MLVYASEEVVNNSSVNTIDNVSTEEVSAPISYVLYITKSCHMRNFTDENWNISPGTMFGRDNITVNSTELLDRSPAQWGWLIKVIASHIIVAVALVANSLTFVVMKSPRLRYKSYSHYLSALAIFDSLVLISQEILMVDEILRIYNSDRGFFYVFSHDACKVFLFADAVCNLMSSWLIVAMAIERLCVVYMPFRRNMWCQQKGAVIIIFTLFCALSCTQAFRFVMVENHEDMCVGSPRHDELYFLLHIYIYQFTLLFIAPVLLTLICNIGVLIRIFSVEHATQIEDSRSTRVVGNARRRRRTTRMLVAITLTYVVTTLPLVVLTITVYAIGSKYGDQWSHIFLQTVPWINLLQAVTNINYASNFFIYILSGRKFRVELKRIFKHHSGNSFTAGSSRTREEILMISY